MRSLMKRNVHIMALTATATKQTRDTIFNTLGMTNTYIVSQSPEMANFSYCLTSTKSINTVLSAHMQQLKVERQRFPKMLIFCQTLSDCANIYEYFCCQLGKEFTHPIGAPNIACFHLVDMYSSVTVSTVKGEIEEYEKRRQYTEGPHLHECFWYGGGLPRCPKCNTLGATARLGRIPARNRQGWKRWQADTSTSLLRQEKSCSM